MGVDAPVAVDRFVGPLVVSLVYLAFYYGWLLRHLTIRKRLRAEYRARGEKFDRYFGQDREMLAADRVQLNTLEHMPPFLVLLWLFAAFVSPCGATWGGGGYVLSRAVYPLLIGRRLGRGIRTRRRCRGC